METFSLHRFYTWWKLKENAIGIVIPMAQMREDLCLSWIELGIYRPASIIFHSVQTTLGSLGNFQKFQETGRVRFLEGCLGDLVK